MLIYDLGSFQARRHPFGNVPQCRSIAGTSIGLWINRTAPYAHLDRFLPPSARYGCLGQLAVLVLTLLIDRKQGKLMGLMGLTAWACAFFG